MSNVRQLQDTGGFSSWYESLPIVCKSMLTTYLATGLMALFGILPAVYMYHDWGFIFTFPSSLKTIPQVWRLVSNFAVIGKPSMNFLFNLVWLVQYGVSYEKGKFLGNDAEAITMAGWGMVFIMLLDLLFPFFRAPFHGQALIFMLLYLWSKTNPMTQVGFFGIIKFQALYLPFALLGLDVIQGASPWTGIRGIVAGHLYWFFTEIFPDMYGWRIVQTPEWLVRLVYRHRASRSWSTYSAPTTRSVPAMQSGAPAGQSTTSSSSSGFRAFTGKAHKLT